MAGPFFKKVVRETIFVPQGRRGAFYSIKKSVSFHFRVLKTEATHKKKPKRKEVPYIITQAHKAHTYII